MLSDRDLLLAESRAPLSLRRTIEDAGDIEAAGGRRASCARRSSRCTTPEPHRLGSPRSSASSRDALTKRLNKLTIAELGPPPWPFSWLALGSIDRREAAPSSDVNPGLVCDGEGDAEDRYMRELGRRISGSLRAAGFVADSHGATAAGPLFDRSFGAWRRIIRTSIEGADRDQALIFISLLSDARPACVGGIPPATLSKTWDRYGIACRSCA